ncbi:hypothetical protein [Streptomyces sp. CA-106110]|uniref:hypothetical protein n=1 Tax=Streptomyces sp. CA-106110 TaxID=3240044 RepID=UPI003D92A357
MAQALWRRAHLDEFTLRQARRSLAYARYWREEASAPLTYITPRRSLAEARLALVDARRLRRQLVALRAHTTGYLTREQWAAIQANAAAATA